MAKNNKTAFITGATGFVGLNIIRRLQEEGGWDIYAMHRSSSNLNYLNRFNVHKVQADLYDYWSVVNAMPENVDVVFHTAANISLWWKNNKKQYIDNVTGTRNVVFAALEKNAGKFIFTSSVSAYGVHDTDVDEKTPSNVESANGNNYNLTKYLAEEEIRKAVPKGLNAVILNPCRIMGPFDTNNWANFIRSVYHYKTSLIPKGVGMLCHVEDVAQAHISAARVGRPGENYLLGGEKASFRDVMNEIETILGREKSTKESPRWMVLAAGYLLNSLHFIGRSEPMLTPQKAKLLCSRVTCKYDKAIEELNYKPSPVSKIVADSFWWLKEENML